MVIIDPNEAMRLLGIANYQVAQMEQQLQNLATKYNELLEKLKKEESK